MKQTRGAVREAMGQVGDAAAEVGDGHPIGLAARVGLTARAVVYALMGLLALLVAFGERAQVDQRGVLTAAAAQPAGWVVVLLLAIGFAAYALWRLAEAALGVEGKGTKVLPRLQSLGRGVLYGAAVVTAIEVLRGAGSSQSREQRTFSAEVMSHDGGRWLLVAFGVGVTVTGLVLAYGGVRRTFLRHLRIADMHERTRTAVAWVGTVGVTARGLVVGLAGAFVVAAAVTYDPAKAGGINGAVKDLRHTDAGPFLLTLVAVGLAAFGVYGFFEARYRRVVPTGADGDAP
jgi:hypothetical protein